MVDVEEWKRKFPSRDSEARKKKAKALREVIEDTFLAEAPVVTGPAEGVEIKRKDIYRQQLLIRHPDAEVLRQIRAYAAHLLGETVQFELQ